MNQVCIHQKYYTAFIFLLLMFGLFSAVSLLSSFVDVVQNETFFRTPFGNLDNQTQTHLVYYSGVRHAWSTSHFRKQEVQKISSFTLEWTPAFPTGFLFPGSRTRDLGVFQFRDLDLSSLVPTDLCIRAALQTHAYYKTDLPF